MQSWLIDIGRIGFGLSFLLYVILDLRTKKIIFDLMDKKNVPYQNFFFLGAISLKTITGICILLNIYTQCAALALALYVFIANVIFNNFWATPKKQRDFSLCLFLTNLGACFGLTILAGVY